MFDENLFYWVNPHSQGRRLLEIGSENKNYQSAAHWIWHSGHEHWTVAYVGTVLRANNRGITIETYSLTGTRSELHYSNVNLVPCTYAEVQGWREATADGTREAGE